VQLREQVRSHVKHGNEGAKELIERALAGSGAGDS